MLRPDEPQGNQERFHYELEIGSVYRISLETARCDKVVWRLLVLKHLNTQERRGLAQHEWEKQGAFYVQNLYKIMDLSAGEGVTAFEFPFFWYFWTSSLRQASLVDFRCRKIA